MSGPTSGDHGWRVFDYEINMEVARIEGLWHIRYAADRDVVTILNDAEFEQLRSGGPNPKGLS